MCSQVPARWSHMLVVSSQVGPPGSRMEGVSCPPLGFMHTGLPSQ